MPCARIMDTKTNIQDYDQAVELVNPKMYGLLSIQGQVGKEQSIIYKVLNSYMFLIWRGN
jgi:hypothetical protein